jgi:protein-L-isoaspartate(D-aspartate) O-methyltransferase
LLFNSFCLFVSDLFFAGTGYLTACFALMVGPEGRAVGVEHIPELVATSTENIKKSAAAPHLNDGSLSIHVSGKY